MHVTLWTLRAQISACALRLSLCLSSSSLLVMKQRQISLCTGEKQWLQCSPFRFRQFRVFERIHIIFEHGSAAILRKLDSPVYESNVGFWFKSIPSYPDMHRRTTGQRRNAPWWEKIRRRRNQRGGFVCKHHWYQSRADLHRLKEGYIGLLFRRLWWGTRSLISIVYDFWCPNQRRASACTKQSIRLP